MTMYSQGYQGGSWRIRTIESLCARITSGGTPVRSQRSFYENGTTPWVKTGELKDWYIDEIEEKITDEAINRSSAKVLPSQTILMAMYGDGRTITSLGILRSEAACNQACCAMIAERSQCLPLFLFYSLKAHRNALLKLAYGGAQRNLNAKTIRQFGIPVPPLSIQEQVVAILSTYDELIENNTRRIKILEEMAQRLYREWFVRFRFPGHENVRMVESELGSVPEGWSVRAFDEIAEITMGLSPKGDSYNEVGVGMPLVNGPVEFGERFTRVVKWTTSPTKVCGDGDLVVCVRGSTTGKHVRSNGTFCLGRGVCGIRSQYQSFVALLFKDHLPKLLAQTSGSTFPSWTGPQLKSYRVLSPTADLLELFEGVVQPISLAIGNYSKRIDILRTTRDLLLPKLISGEIPVEAADEAAAESMKATA